MLDASSVNYSNLLPDWPKYVFLHNFLDRAVIKVEPKQAGSLANFDIEHLPEQLSKVDSNMGQLESQKVHE